MPLFTFGQKPKPSAPPPPPRARTPLRIIDQVNLPYLVQRPSAFTQEGNIIVASRAIDSERMKSLNVGKYDPRTQTWLFAMNPRIAIKIRHEIGGTLKESPTFANLANEGQKLTDTEAAIDYQMPIPLTKTPEWNHQRAAFWFAFHKEAVYLDMGMGTGKSKVVCDLLSNRAAQFVLIICPSSVMNVWPKQFRMHAYWDYEVVVLNKGTVNAKAEYARRMIQWATETNTKIAFVINYESAWRPPFGPTRNTKNHIIDRGFALSTKWDAIVLDEGHRAKNPSGQAARFCRALHRAGKYRLILSGTPMPHSPLDIWSQFGFLDPELLGERFTVFKSKIARLGGYGEYEIQEWINQEWLASILSRITYKVGREVLDLPPAVHVQRTFELSAKARKTYRQVEDEFYAELSSYVTAPRGDERVSISNVLVKLLRCQQITSGYLRDDLGRDIEIDSGKRDMLKDVLEDIDCRKDPVVVFCRFSHDLDSVKRVATELGYRYKELSGRAKELGPDSTYPSDCDIFGVQVQSGGVGIDLTKSHIGIIYSLDRSLGNYDQFLARQDRPGQVDESGNKRSVTYIHLLAENSIDPKIYTALEERRDVIDTLSRMIVREANSPSKSKNLDELEKRNLNASIIAESQLAGELQVNG